MTPRAAAQRITWGRASMAGLLVVVTACSSGGTDDPAASDTTGARVTR